MVALHLTTGVPFTHHRGQIYALGIFPSQEVWSPYGPRLCDVPFPAVSKQLPPHLPLFILIKSCILFLLPYLPVQRCVSVLHTSVSIQSYHFWTAYIGLRSCPQYSSFLKTVSNRSSFINARFLPRRLPHLCGKCYEGSKWKVSLWG